LYAKVLETTSDTSAAISVRFTSLSPEIEAYFRGLDPASGAQAQSPPPEAPRVLDGNPMLPSEASPGVRPEMSRAADHAEVERSAPSPRAPAAPESDLPAPPPSEKKRSWLRGLNRQ
jgi:hypothetical protein